MPAAAAIASMLAAPMPCCSNTSAAASNSFSLVSSRVGRVRTLDMAGNLAHQLDTFMYRVSREVLHARSHADCNPEPGPDPCSDLGQQLLPGRHVARLPRGPVPLL